jgi:hypothetical protein
MTPPKRGQRSAAPQNELRGITPKQAASRTGFTLTTIYGLCRDGLIECQQLRKVWLIFTDEKGRLIPIKR